MLVSGRVKSEQKIWEKLKECFTNPDLLFTWIFRPLHGSLPGSYPTFSGWRHVMLRWNSPSENDGHNIGTPYFPVPKPSMGWFGWSGWVKVNKLWGQSQSRVMVFTKDRVVFCVKETMYRAGFYQSLSISSLGISPIQSQWITTC